MISTSLLVMTGLAVGLAAFVQGREFFEFRWRPAQETAAAVCVGLLAAAFSVLALATQQGSLAYRITLWILIFGLCGFTLPFAYVFLVERRSFSALGLQRKRLGPSLLLSFFFAAPIVYATLTQADVSRYSPDRLARAVFSLNVGGLFELFLYYGFIHLRLREAMGSIPAIVGAAALYSLWHIGTEIPMHSQQGDALVMLFVVGLLCHSVFAITYNVFIIWPFFFTAGVMHDFIVNLHLPDAVTTGLAWPALGFAMAFFVPAALRRYADTRV